MTTFVDNFKRESSVIVTSPGPDGKDVTVVFDITYAVQVPMPRYRLNKARLRGACDIAIGDLVTEAHPLGRHHISGLVIRIETHPDRSLLDIDGRVCMTDKTQAYGMFGIKWGSNTKLMIERGDKIKKVNAR